MESKTAYHQWVPFFFSSFLILFHQASLSHRKYRLLNNGFVLVFLEKERKKQWQVRPRAGQINGVQGVLVPWKIDDNYTGTKRDTSKKEEVDAKRGLNKDKASAMSGAQKLKSGASNSFKWVKSKCQKK